MTIAASVGPRTMVDVIPVPSQRSMQIVRDIALVVGFSVLTAVFAQIKFNIGFTPVPITGQTFAVLLSGTALGWKRGAASQGLYWVAGIFMPVAWYAGDGGWESATGTTAGYLFGFVVAAALVGYLAEHQQDRTLATSVPAMLAGTVVIYTFGVLWLSYKLNVPVATGDPTANGIGYGVAPFLVGDFVKMLLAGAVTPAAWSFIDKGDNSV